MKTAVCAFCVILTRWFICFNVIFQRELNVLKRHIDRPQLHHVDDVPTTHGNESAPSPDSTNHTHLSEFVSQSGVIYFDDVIHPQHEISRLSNENERERLEGTASSSYGASASSSSTRQVSPLKYTLLL